MNRACEPELLDSLPHDHPDAVHNRRDLRLINRIMRNQAWIVRTLPPLIRSGERVLEIGAGMGEMAIRLNTLGVHVDGLDLWPQPKDWPADRSWHVADLKTFDGYGAYAAVVGNLIFHQFKEDELARLGAEIRRTARVVVACEPVRSKVSQTVIAKVAPIFGANYVTLHDAHVSIAAGFQDGELPLALGMTPEEWRYSCSSTALGASRMVAIRRA
jgi:hypothetical protein